MKNIFLTFAVLSGFVFPIAATAQYESMQFITTEGEEYLIPLSGLEIVFSDNGNMVATQNDRVLEIPVSDLVSMQFSEKETGIDVLANDENMEVFGINGISYGHFNSLEQMRHTLNPGTYVIRKSNSATFKITLKK